MDPDSPNSPISDNAGANTSVAGSSCPNIKEYEEINRLSELKWLQFEVVSTDGGQFSDEYKCEYMLDTDSTHVYCTRKKENTNIVLKIAEASCFVLTHILIKAPESG
jgi:hypothetical protein